MKKIRTALVGVAAAALVAATGTPAQAQSISLHNNYGSDRVVTARDSGGGLHYLAPGDTVWMGSSMRIYVAAGARMRYGSPVNGVSFGSVYGPANWVATRSEWVDDVG